MPDKPHIEKAARAIMLADPLNNPTNPPKFPDDFSATEAGQYRNEAIAALSTTLEPSEEEIIAACKAACCPSGKCAADDPGGSLMFCQKDKLLASMRHALITAARVRVGSS